MGEAGGFPDPARRANLDFDARVPIPFSVFPSSYRSDAVPEPTPERVEGEEANLDRPSHVEREDTRTSAPLPDPRVYGKEEVDLHAPPQQEYPQFQHQHQPQQYEQYPQHEQYQQYQQPQEFQPQQPQYPEQYSTAYEDRASHNPQVDLSRESYREPTSVRYPEQQTYDKQGLENQLDITEREYRRRVNPTYDVNPSSSYQPTVAPNQGYQPQPASDVSYSRTFPSQASYDRPYKDQPLETYRGASSSTGRSSTESVAPSSTSSSFDKVKSLKPFTVLDQAPVRKMGYYDDDGKYHSFRRGVERAADRIMHPHGHHHQHDHDEIVVADQSGPVAPSRGNVRVVEPRGRGGSDGNVPIPCHFIRIGDILILQGRPCQVIRISVSPQTGQHRYLGVDLFTRQLQEESSFVANPSPSVVVQTMLGPVYKTYRILDIRDDGDIVAMTENGDVKQGLPCISQGNLKRKIADAFADGRGSVRALVINDGGHDLVVDYKVIHGSRL
ncbi:hypothetical protein ASPWEDRAFT_167652 [Aspergillus wentii DTO 134E9]|uniref:Translation elongation factor IF5A C-terminal domain-containing protein n=1 Tax=Aspergillus wentii DTO 134E9 TaxID=1073089 RepID=A0A1L9S3C3_ASPWE|nr:uncharacterized protein ASPWEDRAFT_167652 [Aspergillus wentii DTO 134E9]KAI9929988.1 hypothetical protein MW887_011798 [Aspergillus wentii]OJJ41643.1 hypothetical protein ASPWEDRAFT_167652 [Aspergillus wentii DTO 134E9]